MSQTTGYPDQPAQKDSFEIQKYIDGLTDFLTNCTTPLTMAIQGDWGTGKTSIMTMIRKKLEDNYKDIVHIVWFNTWQFSQFNMGDSLPLMMMSKLVSSVSNNRANEFKERANQLLGTIGNVFLTKVSSGMVSLDDFKTPEKITDIVDKIDQLKDEFQKLVYHKVSENGPGRVVIFVDDLDRLDPAKAVELLEVLKIFLDCNKCVFVLAIDYGVVSRGVKQKYGADFSEEKGKSFFDKIIQVPFKMPVASYDISNYVKENFSQMGVNLDADLLKSYVCVINDSIGNNPRSMKRLFNAFLLLSKIAKEVFDRPQAKEILFALLCMQSKYESVYNYLIKNIDTLKSDDINSWQKEISADSSQQNKSKLDVYDLIGKDPVNDADKREQFRSFMESFVDIIDGNDDNAIDEKEFEEFKQILSFSAITASASAVQVSADSKGEEKKYRYPHRDKVRYVNSKLNEHCPSLKMDNYFRKTHQVGTWWGWNSGYFHTSSGLPYYCDYQFDPAGADAEGELFSTLTINIKTSGGAPTIREIIKEIGENPLGEFCNGVEAKVTGDNSCLYYKNVLTFRTNGPEKDGEIIDILSKVYEKLLKSSH